MENNKNKKSVKFQEGMFNFCDIIQVFVFTRNHHLNCREIHYQSGYKHSMVKLKRKKKMFLFFFFIFFFPFLFFLFFYVVSTVTKTQ